MQVDSLDVGKLSSNDSEQPNLSQKLNSEQLNDMLDKANRQMELRKSDLRFIAEESSGKMVVAIYDASTEELIRQIPNEQALTIAQKINEFVERSSIDPSESASSVCMILNSKA